MKLLEKILVAMDFEKASDHNSRDGKILRESGANFILSPFADEAKEAVEMLEVERERDHEKTKDHPD